VALLERGEDGEVYNVSRGEGISVESLAHRVLALVGVDAILESDPALVRPADVPVLVGDSSKLRRATDWSPRHSIDSIIDDVIRAAAT
jgi:GDP-4-dehydro-6-deoxy-D-mannose reductase